MEELRKQVYINTLKEQGKTEEEILKIIEENRFICPNCLTDYVPTHKSKEEAFRTNDLEAREQWLSHICSTKCWNEYLGVKD